MKSFFQYITIGIVIMTISSCSFSTKDNALIPNNTDTNSQLLSKLTGSVLPVEAQFKDIVTKLESTKNYNEFSKEYSLSSSKIDEWINQWSWSYIFDHNIVDKIVPYMYICKLTLSWDESTVRSSFSRYSTIIPPITDKDPTNKANIIEQFTSSKISLSKLYDILLSPQVILPSYYIDLISKRKLTYWKISSDDCNELILKYENEFFSEK